MKKLKRTKFIERLEKQYGKEIEELLREMYVDEGKTIRQIADELIISDKTVWTWLKEIGIQTRKMKWE